jgi:hypothetical protein
MAANEDTSQDWWAGDRKCFVSVALATLLATTTLSTTLASAIHQRQEDVSPHGNFEQDGWQPPAPWGLSRTPALSMDADAPVPQAAPFLLSDDAWIASAPWPQSAPQPILSSDESVFPAAVIFQPDEDFWIPWIPQTQQPWFILQGFHQDERRPQTQILLLN